MRPLHGKALQQIDDDVAGPIVPWYLFHVLACIYRFRDGAVRMWNFSSRLQLGVVGWVLGGPKANSTCEFLVSLDA